MSARVLSLGNQIDAMRAAWPRFSARGGDRRQNIRWIGVLRPQFVEYRVEIRYRLLDFPEVRILSPTLKQLPGNDEGALPHVYPPADDPTLCLFDPAADEWHPSMAIAQTIVPWTIDWLACYEWWLITGKWTGGGRHPTEDASDRMGESA